MIEVLMFEVGAILVAATMTDEQNSVICAFIGLNMIYFSF